jgi:hypothetical protein
MWLTDEVASFLAQRPSHEALLAYRPSARALMRFETLRDKSEKGTLLANFPKVDGQANSASSKTLNMTFWT